MANWWLVFPYNEQYAAHLAERGLPRPAAQPGNHLPTFADLERAIAQHPALRLSSPE